MDDLDTFEGWLKHHQYDVQGQPSDIVARWRTEFDAGQARRKAARSAFCFTKPCPSGEHRYAIAIEDGSDLRLPLVVRRSPKGEIFVLYLRDGGWNPHASYHLDGQYHFKGDDQIVTLSQRQPLDQRFKGAEHLGSFGGHDTAVPICIPSNFTSVIRIPRRIVNGMRSRVLVDLVEPGILPAPQHRSGLLREETFRDFAPWLVVAIAA